MDASTTTSGYIPVTTECQYSEVTSVDTIATSSVDSGGSESHQSTNHLPTIQNQAVTAGQNSAYDECHITSSTPAISSSVPPSFSASTSDIREIHVQNMMTTGANLPATSQNIPLSGTTTVNHVDVPLPSSAPSYLDTPQGILSLNLQSSHPLPILWLRDYPPSPQGHKGSKLITTTLPPVSEVHPSRTSKLDSTQHISNTETTIVTSSHQLPLAESDHHVTLHPYLSQPLPSLHSSHAINVPHLDHNPSSIEATTLPAEEVSVNHQPQLITVSSVEPAHTDAMLTDVSSAITSLDRVSNIYSIAPSQAASTSRSHALTSDTTVHTKLPAMMRTTELEHHSHEIATGGNAAHFHSLSAMGLEVTLDKHPAHCHLQHANHLMIGTAALPLSLTSSDISASMLNGALIARVADGHGLSATSQASSITGTYTTNYHSPVDHVNGNLTCGDSEVMTLTKSNHLPSDSTLIPTQLTETGVGNLRSVLHVDEPLSSSTDHDPITAHSVSDSKQLDGLVETLACYRCKVCPFISFNKEGVEQHVRSTHLKLLDSTLQLKSSKTVNVKPSVLESPAHEEVVHHEPQLLDSSSNVGIPECKDNTFLCGMCEKGFPDIESCGVHMALEHNVPVDQVHLEPLPSTTSLSNLPLPPVTTITTMPLPPCSSVSCLSPPEEVMRHSSSTHPLPSMLLQSSKHDDRRLLQLEEQKSVKKRKPKKAQQENGASESVTMVTPAKKLVRERKRAVVVKDEKLDMRDDASKDDDEEEDDIVDVSSASIQDSLNDSNLETTNANIDDTTADSKSILKKRGRPRGSKTLGITALKKKSRKMKSDDDPLLGYRCDLHGCAVRMQSVENLDYHRKCHTHHVDDFECPECKEKYDNWKSMSIHLWRVHVVDMELYTCDLCSYKTYSYSKLMNMHRRIHSDERPFLCDICGKGFKTNKQLRNHKVIHLDKRKHRSFRSGECDVCHRYFSDKRMLRVHKDTVHNKLRPYLCNYCGYAASCRSTLKMHIRQHTGEKPFACDLCDYRTADHNSLRRHKMRHSGEKPYKCPFCPYACIQSSTYKTHLKNKHPGMDEGLMFCCDHCSFRTIKKENYITHMADHKNNGNVPQPMKQEVDPANCSLNIPMHVVLPNSTTTVTIQPVNPSFLTPSDSHSSDALNSTSVSLQPQMEVINSDLAHAQFIFSVGPEEIRQRISEPHIYTVESDNPEERFPILASQLKLGHISHAADDGSSSHIMSSQLDSMETSHINIDSEITPDQVVHTESDIQHVSSEHIPPETLSHAQLIPVPPTETILPHS